MSINLNTYPFEAACSLLCIYSFIFLIMIRSFPVQYYMKTGVCKFGENCRFHHPIDRSAPTASVKESVQQNVKLTLAGLPRREVSSAFYGNLVTELFGWY